MIIPNTLIRVCCCCSFMTLAPAPPIQPSDSGVVLQLLQPASQAKVATRMHEFLCL